MSETPKLKTSCPKCKTVFHISDGHLSKARGLVRCGSCLQIFDAAKNIVYNTDVPPSEQRLGQKLKENKQSDSISEKDKQAAAKKKLNQFKQHLANKAKAFEKLTEGDSEERENSPSKDTPPNNADKWVVELIEEFEDRKESTAKTHNNDHNLEPRKTAAKLKHRFGRQPDNAPSSSFNVNNAPTLTLSIEDEQPVDYKRHNKIEKVEFKLTPEPEKKISPSEYKSDKDTAAAQRQLKLEVDQKLSEPLTPIVTKKSSSASSKFFILLLTLCACSAAVYFNYDKLLQNNQARQIISQVCASAGCTVPTYDDISKIETQGLVLAPSAQNPSILDFRIIIKNTAKFEQEFPAIRLEFRNRFNQIEDTLDIQPNQYMKGELSNFELLPSKTPIQIHTTINYNKPLVGYQVSLVEAP